MQELSQELKGNNLAMTGSMKMNKTGIACRCMKMKLQLSGQPNCHWQPMH